MPQDYKFFVRSEKKEIDAFRIFVVSRHGSLNGFLWKDLKLAMQQFRENNPCTHTQKSLKSVQKLPKITSTRLKAILLCLGEHPKENLTLDEMRYYIAKCAGVDRRTIKNYKDILREHGYVTSSETALGLFVINKKRIKEMLKE